MARATMKLLAMLLVVGVLMQATQPASAQGNGRTPVVDSGGADDNGSDNNYVGDGKDGWSGTRIDGWWGKPSGKDFSGIQGVPGIPSNRVGICWNFNNVYKCHTVGRLGQIHPFAFCVCWSLNRVHPFASTMAHSCEYYKLHAPTIWWPLRC